jgi:hypothetical protein
MDAGVQASGGKPAGSGVELIALEIRITVKELIEILAKHLVKMLRQSLLCGLPDITRMPKTIISNKVSEHEHI